VVLDEIELGEYREGDILEILSIERESFPTPWSEAIFRNELASPLSSILIARTKQGQATCVAGYTVYWRVVDETHVHNIAVRKDLQRRGIASSLLMEVIERTRREGARWATLDVREGNLPARMLYQKMGFSVKGVRPGYYTDTRENAVIMWMELP